MPTWLQLHVNLELNGLTRADRALRACEGKLRRGAGAETDVRELPLALDRNQGKQAQREERDKSEAVARHCVHRHY